jgi:glycosyltransferase involved in cell wall biosynthesis
MPVRPALLFAAPTIPATAGNGLAMRNGVFLEAYARHFEVTLVVGGPAGQALGCLASPFVRDHARRVIVLPPELALHPLLGLIARLRSPEERRAALRAYPRPRALFYDPIGARDYLAGHLSGQSFARAHAGRVYMAPLLDDYLGKTRCILDLDEDDSNTLRRIGALCRAKGETAEAEDLEIEADKFETLMREYLPRFDVSLAASGSEAAGLRTRFPGCPIRALENALRPPAPPAVGAADLPAIDFLMVGNLSYYPNADAAAFFCREVLPRLAGGQTPPRTTILGSEPPPAVLALGDLPGVTLRAGVPDVAPYYRAASVAVVPIRAGGGSRIKILEAFAHGLPVVSTRIGAEGLRVVEGRHLLIADSAEDFAAAARRLLGDRALGARLAGEARSLFDRYYSVAVAAREILALADPVDGMIECARAADSGTSRHD